MCEGLTFWVFAYIVSSVHLRRAAIRQTPTPILQPWAARVVVVSMQAVCVSAQNERDDAFAKGGVGRNHYYEGVMRYLQLESMGCSWSTCHAARLLTCWMVWALRWIAGMVSRETERDLCWVFQRLIPMAAGTRDHRSCDFISANISG